MFLCGGCIHDTYVSISFHLSSFFDISTLYLFPVSVSPSDFPLSNHMYAQQGHMQIIHWLKSYNAAHCSGHISFRYNNTYMSSKSKTKIIIMSKPLCNSLCALHRHLKPPTPRAQFHFFFFKCRTEIGELIPPCWCAVVPHLHNRHCLLAFQSADPQKMLNHLPPPCSARDRIYW